MKIKSRFKDYYDYVAHAYGGGDERVTYVREPLKDSQLELITKEQSDIIRTGLNEMKTREKYLVINGRMYTLVAIVSNDGLVGPYKLFTRENFEDSIDSLRVRYYYQPHNSRPNTPEYWAKHFARESAFAVELSKKIQQPVFLIEHERYDWKSKVRHIVIDKNIPVLSDYGIPHYIQPEQLYQDIAYYVSNKMVASPDLEVHDNMTDKEKIVQHGFDLKQSFRHRK